VKRRKTLGTVYGWLQQAIAAKIGQTAPTPTEPERPGKTPIVVARQDGGQWIVILRLTDFLPIWWAWFNRDNAPAAG
jgi:hypothetical protein